MTATKLKAGQIFPAITVKKLGGGEINLQMPAEPCDWRMIIVYRGKHCPFCTEYLIELNDLVSEYIEAGVDVVAVSGDSEERAKIQAAEVNPKFDIGYELTIEQMQELGLYITIPRSELESDRPFSEPGLFIVNHNGEAQIIDISNVAFSRPELKTMLRGLKYIREPGKNYPVRGTYE